MYAQVGDVCVSYSPTEANFMQHVFFKTKKPCKVGTLCMVKKLERVQKQCTLEPLIRRPFKVWKVCKIVANDGQSQYNEKMFYRE